MVLMQQREQQQGPLQHQQQERQLVHLVLRQHLQQLQRGLGLQIQVPLLLQLVSLVRPQLQLHWDQPCSSSLSSVLHLRLLLVLLAPVGHQL